MPARNSRRAHHGTVSGSSHVRCDRTDRAGSASEAVCRVDAAVAVDDAAVAVDDAAAVDADAVDADVAAAAAE